MLITSGINAKQTISSMLNTSIRVKKFRPRNLSHPPILCIAPIICRLLHQLQDRTGLMADPVLYKHYFPIIFL